LQDGAPAFPISILFLALGMDFGDFTLFDVDGFFIGEGSLMENLGCGFV
jgi:hypothetical protein